jgi:hypothetical protein
MRKLYNATVCTTRNQKSATPKARQAAPIAPGGAGKARGVPGEWTESKLDSGAAQAADRYEGSKCEPAERLPGPAGTGTEPRPGLLGNLLLP